jgi:redox-sensitive bicupin YhaK (pirin superfamily)
VVDGEIEIGNAITPGGTLAVLDAGAAILRGRQDARIAVLGGAPLDGDRHLWWNFVSSRAERIEQAKADWREGRFAAVPGETEFIPMP